jgi:hypothetical protein
MSPLKMLFIVFKFMQQSCVARDDALYHTNMRMSRLPVVRI